MKMDLEHKKSYRKDHNSVYKDDLYENLPILGLINELVMVSNFKTEKGKEIPNIQSLDILGGPEVCTMCYVSLFY